MRPGFTPHFLPFLFIALLAASCAPSAPARGTTASGEQAPPAAVPNRTLTIAARNEPSSLAGKPLLQANVGLYTAKNLFNASLAVQDDRGLPVPRLAEAIPRLNTESWRLFPDGRMETTWKLKPNLAWHDGTPLVAEDFVFGWRVYAQPQLGISGFPPIPQIDEIVAVDDRTVLIRWLRPYPQADALTPDEFDPLPRHILEPLFRQEQWEAIANHPYWNREFVGLGPYRLGSWEPGSSIEATAFDRYSMGKPNIERIRILYVADPNTAIAQVMAGEVQLVQEGTIEFEQAGDLKQGWASNQRGKVMFHANQWKATRFELRPELATPKALLDVRVRRALAHAVDKQGLNDALYNGEGLVAESVIPPMMYYFPAVDAATVKYRFDVRQTERLMNEAGFARGTDGVYVSPADGRFNVELKTHPGPGNDRETASVASGWRDAGFEVQEVMLGRAQAQDQQLRATFPGLYHNSQGIGETAIYDHVSTAIPSPENRWIGGNRGGWISPEYDRLAEVLSGTLNREERGQHVAQMTRIFTDEIPSINMFFTYHHWAWVSALDGPREAAPNVSVAWNVHEWRWTQ